MEQPFTYSPLPSNGWFRLLSILPSHDESSEISCELHHHELSTCPHYEAISYTWGNEDATKRLLCDPICMQRSRHFDSLTRQNSSGSTPSASIS
ncbi:hypothetical protein LB505_012231 [Fusarium chuoi]|nr:hypothetical protein LB505_012231 [Fusarium chuoi]